MRSTHLALLLLVTTLATSAPAPDDYQYDYDYGSSEEEPYGLSNAMFDDLRPRPVQPGEPQASACSWAVVQCCGVPDRMVRKQFVG